MTDNFINAICAMNHNESVFRGIEKGLMSFVEADHTYVYLVLPDKTKIKIPCGSKLELCEIVPIEFIGQDFQYE